MLNRLRIPFLLILSLAMGLSGAAAQSATLPGALGEASGLLAFAGVEADQFSTEPTEPGLVAIYGVELPETEASVLYDGELLADALAVNCLVWSPDGATLFINAQTADGERVIALDVETGEAAETTEETGCDAQFTPSPDGERRAFYIPDTVTERVRVVVSDNADDATTSPVFEDAAATTSPTTWSPDNRFIAFSAALRDADGNITGAEIALVEPGVTGGFLNEVDTLTAYAPAWQPDGGAVVAEPTEEPVATEEASEEATATATPTEETVATEEASEEATATATPTEETIATEEASEEATATATPTEEAVATEEASEEATATATPTEEVVATEEASEEATATATPTEEALATEEPTVEAVAEGVTVTVPREVIVRSGPTALYAEVARLPADTTVPVVGISEDLAWLLLELPDGSEAWIATAPILVFEGDLNSVPTVTGVPTITPVAPTETPTLAPTETPEPTSTPTNTPTPTPIPVTKADTSLLTELYTQDFTEDDEGIILLSGNPWERALVEGNEAYCNLNTDADFSPSDVIYWGNAQWDDYVVETRVRFEEPIIFELYSRLNLTGSLYSAYFNASNQTAQLNGFTPEGGSSLGGMAAKLTVDQWYTMRVELEGDLVRYWLDDTLIVETDRALGIEAGFIGVYLVSGQQACIDDIKVWAFSAALAEASVIAKADTSLLTELYTQDFTDNADGIIPLSGNPWERALVEGNEAYCNLRTDANISASDVIYWGNAQWDDYVVEVRVRFEQPITFELYSRLNLTGSLYSAYFDASNQTAQLNGFTPEGGSSLGGAAANLTVGQWYTLRVELEGDLVRYWLDDTLIVETDRALGIEAGFIGVYLVSGQQACIDDIKVWAFSSALAEVGAVAKAETSEEALLFEQDFTNGNIGVTRRIGGSWEIVNINGDDAYCNRPNPSAVEGASDLIVWGNNEWDNYIVELDVRFVDAVSVTELYTRFATPTDLFSAYLNGTDQLAVLAYFGEGVENSTLGGIPYTFEVDTWYTVRVELNDDNVRYWLDDRLVADSSTVSTWSPGVTGFRVNSQSAACIDNISVWDFEAPEGATKATVTAASANLRGGPGTGFAAVGALVRDEELIAIGRSTDGEWVQVRTSLGGQGWVSTPLVSLEGEFEALPVVEQQN